VIKTNLNNNKNVILALKYNVMDLQAEKLNLLQTIMNTKDESLIMDIKAFLSGRKADWYEELNEEQQNDILEGLAEADRGETVSHAEVVKLFGKWGLK
jgi:predicted transcriptional regulator